MSPSFRSPSLLPSCRSQCFPPPFPRLTSSQLVRNEHATRGTQDLDGIPLRYEYVAIPSTDPYPLTGTLGSSISCAAGELCVLTFTRRVLMFFPSFPTFFQMFVFCSQRLACLVRFPMPFDSFSASLAGPIGKFGGFILFQSVLTICGTFTVVFILNILQCLSPNYESRRPKKNRWPQLYRRRQRPHHL